MADSTKNKDKKTLDAFADDLDAMLTMDAGPANEAHVSLFEDEDAIERLLMGDNFPPAEQPVEAERDDFADIDALIADEFGANRKVENDEFGNDIDDIISDIQINPTRQPGPVVDDIEAFADVDETVELVKDDEIVVPDEVMALETVEAIDEAAVEFSDDFVPSPVKVDGLTDEIEGMKEIDDFSEVSSASDNVADFLMADFDISSGEDNAESEAEEQAVDEFADAIPAVTPVVDERMEAPASETAAMADEFSDFVEPAPVVAPAEAPNEKQPPQVDYSAELAALMNQITVLKKQQQAFKQEMTEKAEKGELSNYLDEVEKLQTEQKKAKRAVDALGNQKPVAAYVANGLAVTALLIGAGLGFQGYIAKSQVGELVPIIAKLQEQTGGPSTAAAADQELIRKQLDELTLASGVTSNEIAEIKKSLQGDSGAPAAGGDLGKQLAELSNQNMQMGAAIEALQSKISALEKGGVAAAKPEKKKPAPPVEQNWVVNLIAYKQDWYAQRKAEEYAAKGVPAKVIKAESKGETWYRLSVDGFKSQYEAAGYAAKVKKTLNLDSVWVARIKD